jgi:RimJ/RimL family protein N-acetyltransferase
MSIDDPLLLDLPAQIVTERLSIVPPAPGDGAMLNRAIAESFAELHEWMPWAARLPSVEESERFVREAATNYLRRSDLPLFLRDRNTQEFIGASGLHRIDWSVPRFEIGYWCRTSRVGRGYIGEAVAAITRLAFDVLQAERVEIRTDTANTRSWRVAERLGFALEGVLRHDTRTPQGEIRDTRVYALIERRALREP